MRKCACINMIIDIENKVMKKLIKKVWDTYCEAMYLAYMPYYRTND